MILVVFLLCVIIILLILKNNKNVKDSVVVDSSVFMDGRIYDIIETNFVSFKLIVPSFIVEDLENISKSSATILKSRAKKALSLINKLKKSDINIKFLNSKLEQTKNLSLTIINIAKSLKCKILTKDFSLCKKASLRNIPVLNITDLETALYPLFLPGDKILVHLVKEGELHNQAIGYFDDKTKIIAEDAKRFIGKDIDLEITSVMFTPTGKMIFGKLEGQAK
ncbi:MAG: hypothetical protein LBJ98_01785 [Endomicrobium sp.]|jgi:uncharacterized protein YacL|nr:hypothetical protein [Endomicrobium sp.]